jgi:FkbM family methyltransferase
VGAGATVAFRLLRSLSGSTFLGRVATLQFSHPVARCALNGATGWLRRRDVPIIGGLGAGMQINVHGSALAFAIGNAEPPLQAALRGAVHRGATVWDIGANIGFYTLLACRLVGPTGSIQAFEPVPDNAAAIRHNLAINGLTQVTVSEMAIADTPGRGTMLVSGYSAFSRLASTSVPAEVEACLDVELESVDHLIAERGYPVPDVVKIDVEGAELQVLDGMRTTIARHHPVILCEVHDCNVELAAFMRDVGYDLFNLDEALPVEEGHRNVHTLATPAPSV